MRCPYCLSIETKVIDKRELENNEVTRRRRECLRCKKRFTTYERVQETPLIVVKKDKTREQFDKNKLRIGILKACEKRPVTHAKIEQLLNDIENELRSLATTEIKSKQIGELVMKKLRELDPVAYVRFASVYRQFKDIGSFEKELRRLSRKKR